MLCAPARSQRGRDLHHRPVYLSAKLKLLLNPKGNKVRLTEKETLILRYLYRAGQRPVSREVRL
jgi:DNA-binding winged helix-turn-helix (wHTH) protein